MRKQQQKQKGFTLVEVIVVSVIVAALAAVAIGVYTTYVNDARENAARNAGSSLSGFCAACENTGGTVADTANAKGPFELPCNGNTTKIQVPPKVYLTLVAASDSLVVWHEDATSGKYSYEW